MGLRFFPAAPSSRETEDHSGVNTGVQVAPAPRSGAIKVFRKGTVLTVPQAFPKYLAALAAKGNSSLTIRRENSLRQLATAAIIGVLRLALSPRSSLALAQDDNFVNELSAEC